MFQHTYTGQCVLLTSGEYTKRVWKILMSVPMNTHIQLSLTYTHAHMHAITAGHTRVKFNSKSTQIQKLKPNGMKAHPTKIHLTPETIFVVYCFDGTNECDKKNSSTVKREWNRKRERAQKMQHMKSFWNDRLRFNCISLSAILYIHHMPTYTRLREREREHAWLARERLAQLDLSGKNTQGIFQFTSQQTNRTKVGAKALSKKTIIIVICANNTHTNTFIHMHSNLHHSLNVQPFISTTNLK